MEGQDSGTTWTPYHWADQEDDADEQQLDDAQLDDRQVDDAQLDDAQLDPEPDPDADPDTDPLMARMRALFASLPEPEWEADMAARVLAGIQRRLEQRRRRRQLMARAAAAVLVGSGVAAAWHLRR